MALYETMNERAVEMTVAHMQTLDRVGMAQEDIAHYAYDFVLSLLYGEYPKDITAISVYTRIKVAELLEKAFQIREVEKRNETWMWRNIVRECAASPDEVWHYRLWDGQNIPIPLDPRDQARLAEWKRKGWITYEYADRVHHIAIVKEEQA
jgi:hypothetical protein